MIENIISNFEKNLKEVNTVPDLLKFKLFTRYDLKLNKVPYLKYGFQIKYLKNDIINFVREGYKNEKK